MGFIDETGVDDCASNFLRKQKPHVKQYVLQRGSAWGWQKARNPSSALMNVILDSQKLAPPMNYTTTPAEAMHAICDAQPLPPLPDTNEAGSVSGSRAVSRLSRPLSVQDSALLETEGTTSPHVEGSGQSCEEAACKTEEHGDGEVLDEAMAWLQHELFQDL